MFYVLDDNEKDNIEEGGGWLRKVSLDASKTTETF
jgi:hypothetical protein